MASFDKIFEKSNISEEKKRSKKIFGRLLINLRNSNNIKLYALMEGVIDTDIKDNSLIIIFGDKASYSMVNNAKDKEDLNVLVSSIESGLNCKIECDAQSVFDPEEFEQFLREEFGRLVTIAEVKK